MVKAPDFLVSDAERKAYRKWLDRKAAAHVKRDRRRLSDTSGLTVSTYRDAIHRAVVESGGLDAYTGERLDWALISAWDNDQAERDQLRYKAQFALLPTVDHVDPMDAGKGFRICAWRTNDAKSDMNVNEFVELCRKVIAHCSSR